MLVVDLQRVGTVHRFQRAFALLHAGRFQFRPHKFKLVIERLSAAPVSAVSVTTIVVTELIECQ